MTFEEIWRQREEDVYPALFGQLSRGSYPLEEERFAKQFSQTSIDPRWLSLGVMEFRPTMDRPSWLYVTTGYSNPWYDAPGTFNPNGESGSGIEFTLATPDKSDWAIDTLQSMLAFDVLLAAGRVLNGKPLSIHDRIPLGAPVNQQPGCLLRNLILAPAEGIPPEFSLPSGRVRLTSFVAVTDAELAAAKADGTPALLDRLRAAGHHPVNDPWRGSIV